MKSDNSAYCTVVVGHRGEGRWLCGAELEGYVSAHMKACYGKFNYCARGPKDVLFGLYIYAIVHFA